MKMRLLSFTLATLLILTLVPFTALAGGSCGEGQQWALSDCVLTISGSGTTADYGSDDPAPWSDKSIQSVVICEGVTGIGKNAFYSCSFSEITLPVSLESVGTAAFYGCKNLTSVKLPEGITGLPDRLFSGCTALTEAELPQSVERIGTEAFKGCSGLKSIVIPGSIKKIGTEAFLNCGSLSSALTLPGGLTSIGKNAFLGTNPKSVSYDGTFEQWQSIGGPDAGFASGKVSCLLHVHSFGTWQSDSAYHWRECICGNVQDHALHTEGGSSCTVCGAALGDVLDCGAEDSYSWSLTRSGVLSLSGSYVPDFAAKSGSAPWYGYRGRILSVVIESGVAGIGCNAFEDCTKLRKVKISDTVEDLDLKAFSGCTALCEFEAAGGNTVYSSLDGVLLSADRMRIISYPAAKSGSGYTFPEAVTAIGENAFSGTCLESITVPGSVTKIGEGAFSNCAALKSAALSEGLSVLPSSLFSGCSALEEITIPESVNKLEDAVFSGCSSLKSAVIPEGVTVIPEKAFCGCTALEEITIPKTVTAVKEQAFDGCTALKTVNFLGSEAQWNAVTIYGSNTALTGAETVFDGHVHNYNIKIVVEPSCLTPGRTVLKCSCGSETETGVAAALGHDYSGGSCSRCGAAAPDSGGQQGHVHDFNAAGVTAPTCTAEGYTTYKCSCGETCKKDYVPASHNTELKNAIAPSCLKGGYGGDGICTVCGKTVTAGSVLPALGHDTALRNEKAASCTVSGYSGDLVCTRCGDIIELGHTVAAAGHKFSGGRCEVCSAHDPDAASPVTVPVFDDVAPGTFCYDAVQWAVSAGITKGTGPSTFSPKAACTRYQIVMFMWRAAGCPTVSSAISFADVKTTDIFYEAVRWAVSSGITMGTSTQAFSPYAACTRGQIVTFLYRAAGSPAVSGKIAFADVAPGSFCHDAVVWASGCGITMGTSADAFSPGAACTRGQVVTFLYRAGNP